MNVIWPLLATVCCLTRLGLMIALHVVPSPYHPVRHAFSDYAVGRTRRLAAAGSVANAATWATLAVAVYVSAPAWSYRITATVLLGVLVVLSVAVIAVPTDLEGSRRTARGVAHYVVAIATFGIAYSLTGDLARWATATAPDWSGPTLTVLHWVALVGLVGLVAGLLIPRLRRYFGALERLFLFAIAVFYLVTSVTLLVG